jgi:hypothetical protein
LGSRVEVLVVASTAGAEVPAARHDAVGRGLEDLDQPRPTPAGVGLHNLDRHVLAGQGERHEDHPASRIAPEGIPAVRQALEAQIDAFYA